MAGRRAMSTHASAALQLVGQQMPRAVQPRPHGSERAAERLRGVGVAHALQIAQHDDLSIAGRQTHDRAAQLLHVALPDQLVGGAGRRVVQTEIRFLLVQPDEAADRAAAVDACGAAPIRRDTSSAMRVPGRTATHRASVTETRPGRCPRRSSSSRSSAGRSGRPWRDATDTAPRTHRGRRRPCAASGHCRRAGAASRIRAVIAAGHGKVPENCVTGL